MKPVIIIAIAFVLLFVPITTFAETESFTVAARNYHDYQIFMNSGDEISFAMGVSGGSNDDIILTLYSPTNSKLIDGFVYEMFSDNFSAVNSGTYTFRFDNTGSMISNKAVSFSYEVKINTYYVYVDPLPNWAIYSGNTVYDSTKAWKDANPNLNFYKADSPEDANLRIKWVREFGVQHVGYAYGNQFIEVGLGDSNCTGDWQPYSTDHVNWIMKHEVGHVLGLEHSSDPTSIMYRTAPSAQYGLIEQQFTLSEGYFQFVPFCNSKTITDFSYNVNSDDSTYGFDVYVVPSINEFHKAVDGNSFSHYSSSECFGEGYLEYSGTCKGLSQGSGLLVALDNRQTSGLTTLTIKQQEASISSTSLQSTKTATISYDSPTVYEENQQALEDVLSQLQDEQINAENEKKILEDRLAKIFEEKETPEPIPEPVDDTPKTQCGPGIILKDGVCVLDERCGTGTILKDGVCVLDERCGTGTVLNDNGQCVVDTKSSKGGGCLIATATYGSELSPQVQQLRELRDNKLLQTESGISFMNTFNDFYYSFSPYIADYERENPVFREAVKITITPMISSLSILNYVDMDSEYEVLGYGISLILLNIGMYVGIPAVVLVGIRRI